MKRYGVLTPEVALALSGLVQLEAKNNLMTDVSAALLQQALPLLGAPKLARIDLRLSSMKEPAKEALDKAAASSMPTLKCELYA